MIKADILKRVEDYARSIELMDDEFTGELWTHSPEATFVAPSGVYRGYDEILSGFYHGVMDALLQDRRLSATDISVSACGDCAVTLFSWEFRATRRDNGAEHRTRGIETQVLIKENGVWKYRHIHYSSIK